MQTNTTVDDLFYIKRGKGGYIETYSKGSVPLVSARTDNNGISGFVNDIPRFKAPAITVERVGGTAFVQLLDFSTVPDDISVLIPKERAELEMLYITASLINNSKWRFSYSRKLTPSRLKNIEIPLAAFSQIKLRKLGDILPKAIEGTKKEKIERWSWFKMESLFELHSGDFHKVSSLPFGMTPVVSCGEFDDGIIDYRDVPESRTYFQRLTIAYNATPLLAKYHPYRFAAKDDVAVAIPKKPFKLATLIFIQFMLNRETWRFSYYRKCFNEKLRNFKIQLPADENGMVNEEKIEAVMREASYWEYYESTAVKIRPQVRTILEITDFQ